ncbi:hypothetical protein HDU83_005211 [Entophlyctis luteolus]|nr:hypothetical protein HDU83_005211 [Entophlyctis luteolus]
MAKGRWVARQLLECFSIEFQDQPREYYERAIRAGKICVNNERKSPDYIIRNGDLVCHSTHRHEPPVSSAPIKIVFRDNDTLIIDKPASIPVHPSGRFNHNTVLGILKSKEYGFSDLYSINRIDRLTSGILLLALNKQKAASLAAELAKRNVSKTYLARVLGRFPNELITCSEPILVASSKLGVNIVNPDGRPSETEFEFRSYSEVTNTSVVVCRPKTGRTHQIRVHLQFLGFPIANDPLYGNAHFWGSSLGKGGVGKEETAAIVERIKAAKLQLFADDYILPRETGEKPDGNPTINATSLPGKTNSPSEIGAAVISGTEYLSETIPSSIPGDTLSADDFPCLECLANRADPLRSQLSIYLHSWKYNGEDWAYETEQPEWADDGFVDQ